MTQDAGATRGHAALAVERNDVPRALQARRLELADLPAGALSRVHVELVGDGLGTVVSLPVLVARGERPGPVFGVTAVVHGNELNGLRVIHDLFEHLDVADLGGTVVGVAVVNVPGLQQHRREFADGRDLNRAFPGHPAGNTSEVFAHRFVDRILSQLDYLVDLHTASFGRTCALHVRADLADPRCAHMAHVLSPSIVVHRPSLGATLRAAATAAGIPAVTLEIGGPNRLQPSLIRSSLNGLRRALADVELLSDEVARSESKPVVCGRSYWMHTDRGGLLEVVPEVMNRVTRGDLIARLHNGFGDVVREYQAPEDGVVIETSTHPVGYTGARILHLGVVGEKAPA